MEDSESKSRDRASSPHLHSLIRHLTRGERKYFKQIVNANGEAKNYMDLFDALEAQEVFDDKAIYEAVKEKIKGQNNFRVRKQYLYTMILRIMRSYPGSETLADKDIKGRISDIRFLIEKGVYTQAEKELRKVKQLAKHSESYIDLLEIISIEYSLLTTIEDIEDLPEKVKALRALVSDSLEYVQNYFDHFHDYTALQPNAQAVHDKTKQRPRDFKQLKNKKAPESLQASVFNELIRYYIENDNHYDKAIDDGGAYFIESYERHECFFNYVDEEIKKGKILPPDLYVKLLAALVIQARNARPYTTVPSERAIDILQKLEPEGLRIKLERQYWIYWIWLSNSTFLKNDRDEINRLLNITPDISEFISRYRNTFRPDQQIRLLFVFSIFLLNNSKYSECRGQLKIIINEFEKKTPIRPDIVVVAHLLLLICDYELNDIFDLKSHIFYTDSYFKKAEKFKEEARFILNFFKDLSEQEGRMTIKLLTPAMETVNGWTKITHPILKYYDFKAWFIETTNKIG